MPARQRMLTPTAPAPSTTAEQQVLTNTTSGVQKQHWSQHVWHTAKRYPIPAGTVVLMQEAFDVIVILNALRTGRAKF